MGSETHTDETEGRGVARDAGDVDRAAETAPGGEALSSAGGPGARPAAPRPAGARSATLRSDAPVIALRGLRKRFRSWRWEGWRGWRRRHVEAVAGLDLEVRRGEIFGFLGPNGAGKTTTIKMLMGLIRPSEGEMQLFGGPPDELATRARVGYLPEHPYFYDYLKPAEILEFYGRLFRIPRSERRRRVDRLLDLVGLEHARDRKLRTFSKGMLQRIGIASALVNEPDLVVLDEPLSGLDPIGRKEMREIVVGLRQQGCTVFFSSHILSDIELVCDRVAIIDQGELRSIGALDELMDAERVHAELVVSGIGDGEVDAFVARLADVRIERIGAYLRLTVHEARTEDTLRVVLESGGRVESVTRSRETLEELFMKAAVRR